MPTKSPEQLLNDLFIKRFADSAALLRFLQSGILDDQFIAHLPGAGEPLARVSHEAILLMKRHALINSRLFRRLLENFPLLVEEIEGVKNRWISTLRVNLESAQENMTCFEQQSDETLKPKHIDQFCVAVAVHPSGKIDALGEVELVKSCILYADHIRLYSPTVSLTLQVRSALLNASPEEAANLAIEYMRSTDQFPPNFTPDHIAQLRQATLRPSSKSWTRRQQRSISLNRSLTKALTSMAEVAERWTSSPAFADLLLAERKGLLSFVQENTITTPMEHITDFVIQAAGGKLRQGMAERATSYKERMLHELFQGVTSDAEYPLLDQKVRNLVSASRGSEFHNNPITRDRSRAPGLGEYLFRSLPVPAASMEELLDLRRELNEVVARFRRGLIKSSAEIKSAQWDQGFYVEATKIYARDIAPALEELDDILHSTPALIKYFKTEDLVKSAMVTGGLVLATSNLIDLAPEIVKAIGLAGFVASTVINHLSASHARYKRARNNDWFLVYEARNRLTR